jgi:hypothetical protein
MLQEIPFVRSSVVRGSLLAACLVFGLGCSSDNAGGNGSGGASTGGSVSSTGGKSGGVGGSTSSTSSAATGGTNAAGGATIVSATGGSSATGGAAAGGTTSGGSGGGSGGKGGATATGGTNGAGGIVGTGGVSSKTGGTSGGLGGTSGDAGGTSDDAGASGGTSGAKTSAGCGKTPSLKNSTTSAMQNTISVGGASRQYIVHWPDSYKNTTPYRLVMDYHGATGSDTAHFSDGYMGLFALSNGTTIFAALSAVGGIWNATTDLAFTDAVLKEIEDNFCIDTSRIMLEGFSQGAAMVRVLGCQRPGVYRALAAHSAGGLSMPSSCQPIPYFGSLGTLESGNGQNTQTDPFAKWNGCTIETFPTAPSGSHVCSNYKGCPAAAPATWCSFDGNHGYQPKDSGASTTWMPKAVWDFFSAF